jgi:DNA-binding NarL/FixJ family response regulator
MTTIVIADDHPVFRRGLRDVIADDGGLQVIAEARDGIEAIALIKQHRPAIAVLDVATPRADGLEVLAQARSWPTAPAFVLLTVYETYAERALQLGALCLCVSHRTVQNHRQNMCEKLGLRGPKALLRFALEHEADLMRGS